jgi:hypothetical protein
MTTPQTDPEEVEEDAAPDEAEVAGIEGDSLEDAIAKLTPEQADIFIRALALTMRKRRLMLVGNLTALLIMVIGMLFAFVAYGSRAEGAFVGWVFLVPFGSAGFVLWFFGKLAKRAGKKTHQTLVEPLTNTAETNS